MEAQDGLIHALLLDGKGGATSLDWDGVRRWAPEQGVLWIHLHRTSDRAVRWIREESGLDPLAADALLAEDSRPRAVSDGDARLINLRGVNLHPQADPEDMVAIRMRLDGGKVVSVRARRLMAVGDVRDLLAGGAGPRTVGELLARLAGFLTERMVPVLQELDDEVDGIEEEVVTADPGDLRASLSELRRRAITLRRYLSPQREALARLQVEPPGWLGERDRLRLREVTDQVTRYVEDLDAARERAAVTHEEIAARLAEHLNRNMYVLSIVAALFLPLGLLTGLLGINVGGIPGANSAWAFWLVCALLAVLAAFQLWLFRRLRMF